MMNDEMEKKRQCVCVCGDVRYAYQNMFGYVDVWKVLKKSKEK